MTQVSKTLTLRSSPHIASPASVDTIMYNVVLALLPVCAFAIYRFGPAALLVILTAVISCVVTEHLLCRMSRIASTVGDGSIVITGLLLGLVLPPGFPLWMVAVGGVFAVGVGKFLFGGLGYNPFNPALVGRALLQAAFPAAMTSWPETSWRGVESLPSSTLTWPLCKPLYDGVSSATPLAHWKFDQVSTETLDLFVGSVTGSTGETSSLVILLGGIYLAARGMLRWETPVAILATAGLCSTVLHRINPAVYAGPMFTMFSGGLMLGAVFMATDMVASPITHLGRVLYGVLIGMLVVWIRVWGGMPEGVMYAILIGNAVSPHIDTWIRPTVYGVSRPEAKP